jgi:hypothetical protein
MVERSDQEAAGRPPSTQGLSRCSESQVRGPLIVVKLLQHSGPQKTNKRVPQKVRIVIEVVAVDNCLHLGQLYYDASLA